MTNSKPSQVIVKCEDCMGVNTPDCPKCKYLLKKIGRAIELSNRVDALVKWWCDSTLDIYKLPESIELLPNEQETK
jgi:hypothetical protein